MSWSTDLFCNITFNRETFNTKYEVQDKIDELERFNKICKDKIRNLIAITEPKKFCPEECDPLLWMNGEYEEALECIEENNIELFKLNLLLDNWDKCHNEQGLAINHPDNIKWNSAFLDGDFVKTIEYPEGHE